MAIYSFNQNELKQVNVTSFNDEKIKERQHLQQAIKSQIDVVAPSCLVIAEEFSEWSEGQRRIDLLAIDKEANLVVIELKRTETGEHMELQSLRYAAMVSTLTFSRAVEIYQKYLGSINSDLSAEQSLLEFLEWEDAKEDDFAMDVRIVLVSSDFSKELTTAVMWLNERTIDIRCVRIIPYNFEGRILVDVQQIIPLPEAESYQVKIRQQTEQRREARKSSKDFTRYQFRGDEYNKRRLVLAVVKTWIKENNPLSLSELVSAFPQDIKSGGLLVPVNEAEQMSIRQGIPRHFLGEGDLVEFSSNEKYAISNQWSRDSLNKFIEQARRLGFGIQEAE